MPAKNRRAGKKMRQLRERLRLSMRDVEDLTDKIATRRHNRAFSISPSRLHDIETKGMTPNIYRLYALSIAYDYDLRKLLAFYGLP